MARLGPGSPHAATVHALGGIVLVWGLGGFLAVRGVRFIGWFIALGSVYVACTRLYEFWRNEAALRVSWGPRDVTLHRHFRTRVLWQRTLRWSELEGVRAQGTRLEVLLRSGEVLGVGAPMRRPGQVEWVAEQMEATFQRHLTFELDSAELAPQERARLKALLGQVEGRGPD